MKRGTLDHPKLKDLARQLGVPRLMAAGLLEALWHFTAERAKAGDVGRFSNATIAEEVFWISVDEAVGKLSDEQLAKADAMVDALVATNWLDRNQARVLCVHDWAQHCDDSVHMFLARAGQLFADGTTPNLSRFSKADKKRLQQHFEKCAARAHNVHTENAQATHCPSQAKPSQAKPSQAKPEPKPSPARAFA